MKKIILTTTILTTSILFATNVAAYVDGPYLGAAIGFGDVHQSGLSDLNNNENNTGFAGRIFAG